MRSPRNPVRFNLYFWLVYRTFSLKGPLRLSWRQLYQQFGSNPARASEANTVPDFRMYRTRFLGHTFALRGVT